MSDRVTLAHGGGGLALRALLDVHVARAFGPNVLEHDAAVLDGTLALSTDGYVVDPIEFPGGDIGRLAVCGTINDLAMAGAMPRALSLAMILEEGLELSVLDRVLGSAAAAADESGVRIVTGDTKVVERGKADRIYLTTTGVGVVPAGVDVSPDRVAAGDVVLVSGDIGRHGAALLSVRGELAFEGGLPSDVAPVHGPVRDLVQKVEVHCLRDPTRGGLAAVLDDLATSLDIVVDQVAVPVHPRVRALTEVFGLDPMDLACEGRFVAIVPAAQADAALVLLRKHHHYAAQIGTVTEGDGRVWSRDREGTKHPLERRWADPMVRIC